MDNEKQTTTLEVRSQVLVQDLGGGVYLVAGSMIPGAAKSNGE
jgi:hypothetical protein